MKFLDRQGVISGDAAAREALVVLGERRGLPDLVSAGELGAGLDVADWLLREGWTPPPSLAPYVRQTYDMRAGRPS